MVSSYFKLNDYSKKVAQGLNIFRVNSDLNDELRVFTIISTVVYEAVGFQLDGLRLV